MDEATWHIKPPPEARLTRSISDDFGLDPLVSELLVLRGLSESETIQNYLQPRLRDLADPFLLPQMDLAVDRLLRAIDQSESVVLYGDYDVDGVTSLTLLRTILQAYGLQPHTFLPHRLDEGYGLNDEGLDRCLSEFQPTLLISVDCGTSSTPQVERLRQAGIDVVILDHHECSAPTRPPASALVNPKLGDDFHYLCSAGVVFKLAHALLKTRPLPDFDLKRHLDIVALGTIADLVPLVGENRTLARKGLAQMHRTEHPGLHALKIAAGITHTPLAHDVGFKLGPRLNASGRLDTAQASLDLLTTLDPTRARTLASQLDRQNRSRQDLEMRIRNEALAMVEETFDPKQHAGIVVGSDQWHPGVVGIVASRIAKKYHRPTFVIAFDKDGLGKGSGRSIPGVSLVQAIDACRSHLEAGGGHDMAAGLSLEQKNLDAFRTAFLDHLSRTVPAESLHPTLEIDLVTGLDRLGNGLLGSYNLLHPLGMGNPQPRLMARGVQVTDAPRVLKEKHLKLFLQQGKHRINAIYFNSAHLDLPRPPWDIAFHLHPNHFRGRTTLDVILEAIRSSQ